MQVLKFGGSSVASAEAMLQTIDIIKKALETDRTILVSSAISGCTDELIAMGRLAAARDESYRKLLEALKERHHQIVEKLLPPGYRSKTTGAVDALFGELESIVQGVYPAGRALPTSLSAVESFGELLSTCILTDQFLSQGMPADGWTPASHRHAGGRGGHRRDVPPHPGEPWKPSHTELFVVPGFIAR